MEFGIGYFPTHDAVGPGDLARLVQERGHESLFFAEHTHIPASRESPYRGGGELPRKYSHTYDLFVALTAAAAATSTLRVGSGICLVVERDPITTAKEVASVDHLSGGRLEFGVGAGWNREEMANHGTDPRTRMRIMQERIEAMKAIWTQDEASYSGEYVNFERIWSWPKPAQRPHPPVLVGGYGPDGARPRAGVRRRLVSQPRPRRSAGARPGAARAGGPAHRRDGDGRARRRGGARSRWSTPASGASCTGSRRVTARSWSARWSAGSRRSPRSTARRDLRRGALALRRGGCGAPGHRGPRGAAACRAGRVRGRRRSRLQRRRRQAEAHHRASAACQRSSEPGGVAARRPLRRRLVGAVVGARRRHRAGAGRRATAEAEHAVALLRARYPQQRATGAVLAVDVERWSGWAAA